MSACSVSIKGILRAPAGEITLLFDKREEQELPGGRIELGESSTECLVCEVAEELSLHVETDALVDTCLFEAVSSKYVFIATYVCALLSPFEPTVSHEHKRLRLFMLNALSMNLPAGYRAPIATTCSTAIPPDQYA